MNERQATGSLIAILALFIVVSLAYSVVNPLHEATDELRHYRFVQHIVQRGSLPVQGEDGCSAQGHHPPLYYALAAAATAWIDTGHDVCYEPPKNPFWAYRYWEVGRDNKNQYLHGRDEAFPWSGEALAAHIARAVNVLIGAATVWLTYLIARAIWPTRPYLAVGGAAIIAFNPMFLYMAGAINNDVIAALAGAAVTLGCVRLLRDPRGLRWQWGIIFGLLYSLALMAKFNLAAIGLTIAASVTYVAWRKQQWRQWLVVGGLALLVTAVGAGWWFVRNQLLYGEPTGFERLTELWGVRDPADSFGTAVFELSYLWTSLWGRFGYGQIPLPQIVYDVLWYTAVFCTTGLIVPVLRRDRDELRDVGVYLLVLALNCALFFGVVFNYLLVSPAGPMGRFFFPALPSLALLLFYGLSRWATLLRRGAELRSGRGLAWGTGLVMLAFALVALFGYLQPAFARPPGFDDDVAMPHAADATLGGFVKLRGYDISTAEARPGDPIDVDLYWEVVGQPPGDYLMFVHLIDEAGVLAAQRDTYSGLGNFPSGQWQPGDRFVESLQLFVPETAYTPATAVLSVGFYAPVEGYRLGVTLPDGSQAGDAVAIGEVALRPLDTAVPNIQTSNFENQIVLKGYEYEKRLFQPGDWFNLTLYWEALAADMPDYVIQLRVLDQNGNVMHSKESRPEYGNLPTSTWTPGTTIADNYTIVLGDELPDGFYQVQLAVEEPETERRLSTVAPDGHLLESRVLLSPIRVQTAVP